MTIDDLALTLHPELGCRTAIHLLECFGSAEAVFAASAGELVRRAELKPALARSLCRREYHQAAERELAFCERNRIRPVAAGDESYPRRLLECADYPHVIYLKGGPELSGGHWLSVVGTRKATPYGQKMCDRLIGELSALFPDLVVVSGLAYGIDVAAHRAAMQHGVRTVAVLGHPLTHIYPQAHTETARRIVSLGGTLISEYPSTARPDKAGFVQRNRLIAALSGALVVVEAKEKSGTMSTVSHAERYGKPVFAVPGSIYSPNSAGTNGLLRDGRARAVCSAADLLGPLGLRRQSAAAVTAKQPEPLSENERKVLSCIGPQPLGIEELCVRSGLPTAVLLGTLMKLELSGRVLCMPGKRYVIK